MHPLSPQALTGLGGDPGGHLARQLTPDLVSEADMVLTMTRAQRRTMLSMDPRALRRTFTLPEAVGLARAANLCDVRSASRSDRVPLLTARLDDPIGQSRRAHEAVARCIAEHVRAITGLLLPNVTDMAVDLHQPSGLHGIR